MKKFIILSLTALLSFSSCHINGGSLKDPNGGNEQLWDMVIVPLHHINYNARYAILADIMMSENQPLKSLVSELWFSNYIITTTSNAVTLELDTKSDNEYIRYTIITNGTPLAQGGVWRTEVQIGKSGTPQLLAIFTGSKDKERSFSFEDTFNYDELNMQGRASADVEYYVEGGGIYTTFSCAGNMVIDNRYALGFATNKQSKVLFGIRLLLQATVDINYQGSIIKSTTAHYNQGDLTFTQQ